jgi:hypothetical protein
MCHFFNKTYYIVGYPVFTAVGFGDNGDVQITFENVFVWVLYWRLIGFACAIFFLSSLLRHIF